MARFEVTANKAGINAANSPMWQFKCASTSRARIFEIALSCSSAPTNGPSWRLVRSTANGTPIATQTAEEQDPGGATATAVLDTTWSTPPTQSSVSMRRYATPNTVGSGIVWTWPDHRPLIVPLSTGVVIVNDTAVGAAPGAFNVAVVFEE